MKSIDVIGYKREDLGTKTARKLRQEGYVPCVVYGDGDAIHFYSPMILFRDLVYTSNAHMVKLNVEGIEKKCILQDIQFHPVTEVIMHADFLEVHNKKEVKMDIPVHFQGVPAGVQKGGTLVTKRLNLTIKALPDDMPEYINVDVSKLDLGKSVKVRDVKSGGYNVLENDFLSVATVEVPRTLRGTAAEEEEEGEEEGTEEGAAASEEGGEGKSEGGEDQGGEEEKSE